VLDRNHSRLLLLGLAASLAGVVGWALGRWGEASFGRLDAEITMRAPILGMFLIVVEERAG
jgi:hypothetical protein